MKEAGLDDIDEDILLTKTYNPHHADLADELSAILSLDELETRIYLNLLRTGPITASALSKEINIDRAKAYRTIDKMSNDGIVSISFSSPKLCIATDPDEILSLALRRKEEELIKIKKGGKQIIEKIKKVVNTDNKTNVPTFRVIQGIENISSQIERILEDSTGMLYFVTTLTDVSRLYHSKIPEKIKLAQRVGGDVRLIVDEVPPKMTPFVKRFGLNEVRIGKLPSKGRIVVSKNCPVTGRLLMSDSAVRGTLHENTDTECALFTNSEEMTNNIFTLCDFLWKTSNQLII
ncbi:MAG TPA: helix-turn-helix domain-containing protein [Candidatus Nitrosotenuis sp.]|nr:helix-turn-helix domain-containing protein [Candidatus Nitrosotenuis sp.]